MKRVTGILFDIDSWNGSYLRTTNYTENKMIDFYLTIDPGHISRFIEHINNKHRSQRLVSCDNGIQSLLSKRYKNPNCLHRWTNLLQILLWKSSDLIVEELLGSLPDWNVLPVLQLQQTWEKIVAERLTCLPWQQRWEMINADDAQFWLLLDLDWDRWLVECGGDGVNWNWVVWVCGISADIADDRQLAVWGIQALGINEVWNFGGQVDAVDEDIAVDDLLEWPTLGGLGHIPLDDVLIWDTGTLAEIHSAGSASSESSNNEDAGCAAGLLCAFCDGLLDVGDQGGLVGVGADAREWLAVSQLPGPVLKSKSGAGKASVVSVCGDTAASLVNEELEVEKGPVATREAGEDGFPSTLSLIAMCELDVYVLQWDYIASVVLILLNAVDWRY